MLPKYYSVTAFDFIRAREKKETSTQDHKNIAAQKTKRQMQTLWKKFQRTESNTHTTSQNWRTHASKQNFKSCPSLPELS